MQNKCEICKINLNTFVTIKKMVWQKITFCPNCKTTITKFLINKNN